MLDDAARFSIAVLYLIAMLVVAIVITSLWPAHAHDASMASSPEEARVFAFYKSWQRMPDRRMSCCSDQDCHAVDIKRENGKYFFFDKTQLLWREIPEDRIESNASDPRESPDGRNHVCYNTMYVLCAVLGSGQ